MDKPLKLVWAGENNGPTRVDRWPNTPRSVNTIGMYTHAFDGSILIQGSITLDPTEDDWFDIVTEDFVRPFTNQSNIQNRINNFEGRIIWMRAVIQNNSGRVDRVLVL